MKELHFSVVIPVYNGAAFIANAINSCLAQIVPVHEIIVIDDASTDETPVVIGSVSSPLIKYFRNEINSGPSASRNRGIQLAEGNWILFLDADDVFHPAKTEILQSCILKNEQINAIGHAFDIGITTTRTALQVDCSPSMITAWDVLLRNPIVTPALAVSTRNGILFNERMNYAEDHDFILRTAEEKGLWYIDIPLCSLGREPLSKGGLSQHRWKMRKGEIHLYMDYCRRHGNYLGMPFLILFSLIKHVKNMISRK